MIPSSRTKAGLTQLQHRVPETWPLMHSSSGLYVGGRFGPRGMAERDLWVSEGSSSSVSAVFTPPRGASALPSVVVDCSPAVARSRSKARENSLHPDERAHERNLPDGDANEEADARRPLAVGDGRDGRGRDVERLGRWVREEDVLERAELCGRM